MTRSDFPHSEPPSAGKPVAIDLVTFSGLYDRHAPALLGIIAAIVRDETEAARLLEATFIKIRLQFGQKPESQPLFIWLLSIARATALDSVGSRKQSELSVFKLTDAGKLITPTSTGINLVAPVTDKRSLIPFGTNELLDAVLFRNCTPEEAALSVGLPVATARQQLRLAMQQLRPKPA